MLAAVRLRRIRTGDAEITVESREKSPSIIGARDNDRQETHITPTKIVVVSEAKDLFVLSHPSLTLRMGHPFSCHCTGKSQPTKNSLSTQLLQQRNKGLPAMAQRLLLHQINLGHRFPQCRQIEKRVIAKAAIPAWL